MASSEADETKQYERLVGDMFTYGSVALALAMAKETGMVSVLCQAKEPLSSSQIALQGKLKERYVREVLNGLTVAGFVRLAEGTGGTDGQQARYWVPESCRPALLQAGMFSLTISACARQFSGIKECFDQDGPNCVRYEANAFNSIDELALMLKGPVTEAILQTLGLKQRLESGIEAAEVGCGTGRLSCHLAAMFPKSHFTMTDLMTEPLERARQLAKDAGLTNVTFLLLDVCQPPQDLRDKFDLMVAQDVIHDLPHPAKALQGIRQALRPGGLFSLVDEFVSSYVAENVDNKDSAALYCMGTFMCIPESYQQPDSEALGPCWGTQKAKEMVNTAGFNVLGLTRSDDLGTQGVMMCQKPE